jgi:hypothetical protein
MTNSNPETQDASNTSSFLRDIIAENVSTKKDRGKVALPPIHRP